MSITSRLAETKESEEKQLAVIKSGKMSISFKGVTAVSDRLIAVKNQGQVFIVDLEVSKTLVSETKDADETSICQDAQLIDTEALCLAVSENGKHLVILGNDKIKIWHLENVYSAEDFKKMTPDSFDLSEAFKAEEVVPQMFFAFNNTHVLINHLNKNDFLLRSISSINLKNGNRELIETGLIAQGLLDENKLCAIDWEKAGVSMYDIQLDEHQKVSLSHPVNLIPPLPFERHNYCVISPDKKHLAVERRPIYIRGAEFTWYAIQDNFKLNSIGFLDMNTDLNIFNPLFTLDNALIVCMEDRIEMIDSESHTSLQMDRNKVINCCVLPNGNIFIAKKKGDFSLYRGPQNAYQKAYSTLLHTIEVGDALQIFPGTIAKMIGGYLEDCRFFSKSSLKHCDGKVFEREVLKNVLDCLLLDEAIEEKDKIAIRDFNKFLTRPKSIDESVKEALKTLKMTDQLKTFLQDLENVFSPAVEKVSDLKIT